MLFIAGNILVNLSQSLSSDVIKIGFVISIAFSFPLVIFPCRASLYSLLHRHGHMEPNAYIPESKFRALTGVIVGCSLVAGFVIPSVELVIGLVGSTIGIAICIVFPSCCFNKVSKKESTEKLLAKCMIVGGLCLMILGTYANLNAIDDKAAAAAAAVHVPEHNNINLLPDVNSLKKDKSVEAVDQQLLSKLEYKVEEAKSQLINVELEAKKLIDTLKEELEKAPEKTGPKAHGDVKEVGEEEEGNGDKKEGDLKKPLNNDAIEKEEEEELDAKKEDKESKVVVQGELNAVVDEIKRQNEESQMKVLKKLEEIVEKIENNLDSAAAEKEKKQRPLDSDVVNQVMDKFPDPIPLRAMTNNSSVDPPKENPVGQVKDEVLREAINMEIKLNLMNVTKDRETREEKDKEELNAIVVNKDQAQEVNLKDKQIETERKVQNIADNKDKEQEKEQEKKRTEAEKDEGKKHDEDADAIRRDLLNVDNESLARLKRNADCEKEI